MTPLDAVFNAFIAVVGYQYFEFLMAGIIIFEFFYTIVERFDML